jgi:hypothetical protein
MADKKKISKEDQQLLKDISFLESSNGLNVDHEPITDAKSIQAGTQAVGSYGLMPNTIMNNLNREARDKQLTEIASKLYRLKQMGAQPQKMANMIASNPEMEQEMAATHLENLKEINPEDTEEQLVSKWKAGDQAKISPEQAAMDPRNIALKLIRQKQLLSIMGKKRKAK